MNPYDRIAYPDRPNPFAHPGRLAALGRLKGLDPAPPETARVLEVGTGEGANLAGLAMAYREADFVGIDLAASPIVRGQARLTALGLANVRLEQRDLRDVGASLGRFDYVIAHGLYAWTPPDVGDHLLALARAVLTPHGLAFVSYNTLPGGYLRTWIRDAVLLSRPRGEDSGDALEHARAVLRLLATPRPDATALDLAVAAEATTELGRSDAEIFHDLLAPIFVPVTFRAFVAHAGRHGLQYVDEACVVDTHGLRLSREAVDWAAELGVGGPLLREQRLDLLRARKFRQSVLCHEAVAVSPSWDPARAIGLHASSRTEEVTEDRFTSEAGGTVHITSPEIAQYVRRLADCWPEAVRVGAGDAELALALCERGLLDLSVTPQTAARPSERPCLSVLARYQLATGAPELFTLTHRVVAPGSDEDRRFLALLDGTRDRATLADAAGVDSTELGRRLGVVARHGLLQG